MDARSDFGVETHDMLVKQYGLEIAENDGTLGYVGSTYSPESDVITDGLGRNGPRVVTFGPVLRHRLFPLPDILELLLDMGTWGMGTPVEIEFAVIDVGKEWRAERICLAPDEAAGRSPGAGRA